MVFFGGWGRVKPVVTWVGVGVVRTQGSDREVKLRMCRDGAATKVEAGFKIY